MNLVELYMAKKKKSKDIFVDRLMGQMQMYIEDVYAGSMVNVASGPNLDRLGYMHGAARIQSEEDAQFRRRMLNSFSQPQTITINIDNPMVNTEELARLINNQYRREYMGDWGR